MINSIYDALTGFLGNPPSLVYDGVDYGPSFVYFVACVLLVLSTGFIFRCILKMFGD